MRKAIAISVCGAALGIWFGGLFNGTSGVALTPAAGAGEVNALADAAETGWGTIKGRVVWGGEKLPEPANLDVTKDQEHCLSKGAIKDESVVVDSKTKGVRFVFAFVKNPSAVHPDFPKDPKDVEEKFRKDFETVTKLKFDPETLQSALADAKERTRVVEAMQKAGLPLIDQVTCRYAPRCTAAQEGQKTLVLNFEPVTHNVKVSSVSGRNDVNPNMPPNTLQVFEWVAENTPLAIECGIHGWMKMHAMVFDHPYFAVTAADGSFEIKNVPAGEVNIVLRNPKYIDPVKGGKGTAKGAMITVRSGEVTDLGEIKYSGE